MKRKSRKKRFFAGFFFLIFPLLFFFILFFGALSISNQNSNCDVKSNSSSSSSPDEVSSQGASDTDPFTPGTTAYNNAKKVFDKFVEHGFSGPAAAGIIGWINSEGSFDIVGRAQGHYGGGINDSISKGAVPNTGGTSNTLGGGGIFQFDPYTKYAPLGSPDWEDIDKMVAFVLKAIKEGDWNPAYDESGNGWSVAEFARQMNIEETSMAWNAYERGNMAYVKPAQKKGDGKRFYDLFDAGKIKFDEAKFNAYYGGTSKASESKDQAGSSSSTGKQSKCSSKRKGGSSSLLAAKDMAHLFDEPYRVAQPFGPTPWSTGAGRYLYPTGEHTGLDLIPVADPDSRDVPVYAVADGEVVDGVFNSINGYYIWQTMPDGNFLYYGHLRYTPLVKVGDKIKKGQQIGVVGQSGSARGILTHVHLEYAKTVSYFQNYMDPSPLIIESGSLVQDQIIDPRAGKEK